MLAINVQETVMFVFLNIRVQNAVMDTFWLLWMQVEQEIAKFVTHHV